MSDAFTPYDPLNSVKPFGEDIWIVDGPEIRMDYAMFAIPFPTRMTIVRLPGERLWLHSPIAPSEMLFKAVEALGGPAYLIAPNSLHYWFVPDWHARYPDAQVFVVPGLATKTKRPLPAHEPLGDVASADWQDDIDQALVPGTAVTETVFFHRCSRTVILCDLIENFEPERIRSWWLRKLVELSGAADPDGKAPIDLRLTFRPKMKIVSQRMRRILGWNADRVIMAHGRPYVSGGAAELRRSFRWVPGIGSD